MSLVIRNELHTVRLRCSKLPNGPRPPAPPRSSSILMFLVVAALPLPSWEQIEGLHVRAAGGPHPPSPPTRQQSKHFGPGTPPRTPEQDHKNSDRKISARGHASNLILETPTSNEGWDPWSSISCKRNTCFFARAAHFRHAASPQVCATVIARGSVEPTGQGVICNLRACVSAHVFVTDTVL